MVLLGMNQKTKLSHFSAVVWCALIPTLALDPTLILTLALALTLALNPDPDPDADPHTSPQP